MIHRRPSIRIFAGVCIAGVVLFGAFVALCNAIVLVAASPDEFRDLASIEPRPVAIVFGAGLEPDGSPTPIR